MDVVGVAVKDRVIDDVRDDVEVAGRSAAHSRVSLAGETDTLSIAGSGLDAEGNRLGGHAPCG